jgi:hypothetical protein
LGVKGARTSRLWKEMYGQLHEWDVCTLRAANDNEEWSPRKSFVFLAASSSLVWVTILLLLRLTTLQ